MLWSFKANANKNKRISFLNECENLSFVSKEEMG